MRETKEATMPKKKLSAKRAKKELLLISDISVPSEILPWERDLLTPVIEALRVDDTGAKEQAHE